MYRLIREFLYALKRPILVVFGVAAIVFLLEKGLTLGLLFNAKSHALATSERRKDAYVGEGKLELSEYISILDVTSDRGCEYLDTLYENSQVDTSIYFENLNQDILNAYSYQVDKDVFTEQITSFLTLYPPSDYDFSIHSVGEYLRSGGRIYNVYLAKPSLESKELVYDTNSMQMFSFTVYFKDNVPVSMIPFPEPLMDSYSELFGLY